MFLFVLILGLLRSDIGCAPTAGAKHVVELNFWNGWTGPDGRVMLEIIRRFHKENPDIEVTMQRMEWATYYNKLMVAATDGRGPEVFVIQASSLPRMHRAGFISNVTDMYQGPDAIPPDDFEPIVIGQTQYGNDRIGVPLDIFVQGMFTNADLLKKAGLVDTQGNPRPPESKDEFLAAAKAMRLDTDHDGHPDQWGFALTVWRNNFQALLPQFDGKYFDDNGNAALNSPGDVAALDFIGSLSKQYGLVPPAENALGWVGFRQAKVAMVWDGIYMMGDLARLNDLKVIAAPLPVIGNHPGTIGDSHVLCIRNGVSDEQRVAAEKFIRYLSAHSIEWAAAGQIPARRSIRSDPKFAQMPIQSSFAKMIPYMVYQPRTTALFEMNLELDLAVEKVVRGRATAKEALDAANANLQGFVDRDRRERAGATP
jgi:multiple sugar transport system substrate-binding protein